jgi:RNA polymerase sigma-70 factor (ECF subfamily)
MVAVLKSIGAPSQADFHAAISKRSDRWYSACLRITRNPAMAEDAVQEALLTAWNKRDQFQRTAKLETWIHRIAVNAALQMLRKQRPALHEPIETDLPDASDSPEQAGYGTELDDYLAHSMQKLSDIERVCFVLKHLEEWRHAEIGQELGMTIGNVKQAVFRAVKKLRTSMADLKR